MKTSDGSFHYCFNGQAVVDEKSQVVLAASLRQSPADCPALPDMLTELAESLTAAGIDGTPPRCWPMPGTSPRTTSRQSPMLGSTRCWRPGGSSTVSSRNLSRVGGSRRA